MGDARLTLPVHGSKEETQLMRFQTTQHQLLYHHLLNRNQFQHATHSLTQNANKLPPMPQSTLLHSGRLMLNLMRTTLFKATQSATVPNAVNISTPREKMTTQSTIPSQISELTEISDGPKLTPKPLETSTQTSLHQKPTNQLISN